MQAQLAQFSLGRAVLHVVCACRDHKYYWHWLGIRREIRACARVELISGVTSVTGHEQLLPAVESLKASS
jgi:hypothetical protein